MAGKFGCYPVMDPSKSGWQIIIWLGTCSRVSRFSGPLPVTETYHIHLSPGNCASRFEVRWNLKRLFGEASASASQLYDQLTN